MTPDRCATLHPRIGLRPSPSLGFSAFIPPSRICEKVSARPFGRAAKRRVRNDVVPVGPQGAPMLGLPSVIGAWGLVIRPRRPLTLTLSPEYQGEETRGEYRSPLVVPSCEPVSRAGSSGALESVCAGPGGKPRQRWRCPAVEWFACGSVVEHAVAGRRGGGCGSSWWDSSRRSSRP